MRIFMLIAVALLIVAAICAIVPTALVGVEALGWFILGMLFWAIDVLIGGYVVPVQGVRRTP